MTPTFNRRALHSVRIDSLRCIELLSPSASRTGEAGDVPTFAVDCVLAKTASQQLDHRPIGGITVDWRPYLVSIVRAH